MKKIHLKLFPLLLATALAAGSAEATELKVIGYVTDGETPAAVSPGKLDVINFAFATVDDSGRAVLTSPTASARLAELVALRQRQPKLQIVLSIGGWGAGHFSEAVRDAEARQRFADSAIALLQQHQLDGLDIDWEYPTLGDAGISHAPADRDNFSLMLELLRQRLDTLGEQDGHGHYLLTIAAAEGRFAQGLDLPRITAALDWINLMSYDFHGSLTPTTGHHAGLGPTRGAAEGDRYGQAAVEYFLSHGVPAAKLNLGAAFYGRRFGDVKPERNGLLQPFASDGGFISWSQIVRERLGQPGWEQHWDAEAQAPWLWNPQQHAFISYEDPRSLQAKAAYVREQGLGGIMYWDYRQDLNEQLLDVLDKALHQH